MKTIKQVADELGVSKDKVKYQVGKLPENYLVKSGKITYIKSEGIQRIKDMLGKNYLGNYLGKSEEFTHFYPPLIDVLQDTISTLQQQLSVKDKQLEEKDNQIKELLKLNDHAQELQLNIQKKISVQQNQEEKTEESIIIESVIEPKKDESEEKKKSVFSKIFRK